MLVANDHLQTRYAVARSLRDAGYKTMEAATGAQALEFAEHVSAIVLDIDLPVPSGFEVCRLLRTHPKTAALPIVHLTATHVTEEDRQQSQACGADAYLESPVASDVLVDLVDARIAASDPGPQPI